MVGREGEPMKLRDPMHPLWWLLLIAVLGGLAVWNLSVWRECRAAGHSKLYCARLVAR